MNPINKIHSSNLPVNYIEKQVPSDILKIIFSLLPLTDFLSASSVSRRWRALCKTSTPNVEQNIIDDLKPLISKGLINALEFSKFSSLSTFIERCNQIKKYDEDKRESKLQYGNLSFKKILCDYRIEISTPTEHIILSDPLMRPIDEFQVVGNHVFALTEGNQIIQWNYKTKMIVQTFETAYSRKDEILRFAWEKYNALTHLFYVNKDLIIINYEQDIRFLEIIPYHCPEHQKVFELRDTIERYWSLRGVSVLNNIIYFCDPFRKTNFHAFDLTTGKEFFSFKASGVHIHICEIQVLDNVLLAFIKGENTPSEIHIYNLCTRGFVGGISMDNNTLENLVAFFKKHRKPNPFSTNQSTCLVM